jgi:4'-phosphopantetheinyl transferase
MLALDQVMLTNSDWPIYDGLPTLDDEVHVWAVPLATRQAGVDQLSQVLSSNERKRAAEFRVDDARRRFVIARAALRHLLGAYLGIPPGEIGLTSRTNEKPILAVTNIANDLQFNLSHSGELALIAVANGCEVGIDVEQVRAVGHLEQISKRFFHPAESEAVFRTAAKNRNIAFLRCWTAKEAILKAVGTGITGSLADFRVPIDEHRQSWIECGGTRFWVQPLVPSEHYVGAVACVESERPIRCWTFLFEPRLLKG